ncbi:MAG: serine kinase [Vicinamibacterales bacterium]
MPRPTSPESAARDDRRALFRIVDEAFEDAAALAGGAIDERFRIGGELVHVRFAGDGLLRGLTRALAHLRTQSTEPAALTLHVWDSYSTGRPLPLLATSLLRLLRITWLEDRGFRGEILGYSDQTFRAALEGHDTDMFSLLDLEQGRGVLWTPDCRLLPWYESGAPLRTLLSWWFESQGRHLVHGGAVGLERGGVLLAGRAGAGKSTAALACLGSELRYAGDDYSLVQVAAGLEPRLSSLYNTAKVKSGDDFVRFPWMRAGAATAQAEGAADRKPMLFLHEHQPEALIDGFPLKAIVLPRFIPGLAEPTVVPVEPSSAFKALAESTIPQRTGSGSAALHGLSLLTRQVPAFLLGTTPALDRIAPVLSGLLRQRLA